MKKLILILALLLPVSVYGGGLMMSSGTVVAAAGGGAAPAYVDSYPIEGENSSSTLMTLAWSPVAGNLITVVMGVWGNGSHLSGVTDNKGNTYTKAFAKSEGGSNYFWAEQFYSFIGTGGSNFAITATLTGSTDHVTMALEYSNVSAITDTAVNTGTGADPTTNTATATDTGVFLALVSHDSADDTPNAAWTERGGIRANAYASVIERIVSGTYEGSWTRAAGTWSAGVAVYE